MTPVTLRAFKIKAAEVTAIVISLRALTSFLKAAKFLVADVEHLKALDTTPRFVNLDMTVPILTYRMALKAIHGGGVFATFNGTASILGRISASFNAVTIVFTATRCV
jgi:hypothetical protein